MAGVTSDSGGSSRWQRNVTAVARHGPLAAEAVSLHNATPGAASGAAALVEGQVIHVDEVILENWLLALGALRGAIASVEAK